LHAFTSTPTTLPFGSSSGALEIEIDDALQRSAFLRFRVGPSLERDGHRRELRALRQERLEITVRRIGVGRDEAVEPAALLRNEQREVPSLVLVTDLRLHDAAVGITNGRLRRLTERRERREDASVLREHRTDGDRPTVLLDLHDALSERIGIERRRRGRSRRRTPSGLRTGRGAASSRSVRRRQRRRGAERDGCVRGGEEHGESDGATEHRDLES
jgi:hypothetical protein